MSSKHQNINFSVEKENVSSLWFLDVKICGKNGKFISRIYRKLTFSEIFTNYVSFNPTYRERGLLHTLLDRSLSICCDFKTFHFEIDHLKIILIKNNYPLNFLDSGIKSFLNELYTPMLRFRMYLKKMFLLRYQSLKVLCFKFERSFKNYLVIN